MKRYSWQILTLLLAMAQPTAAHVKLPAVFGDHMVLQQKTNAPFWGWADPGESVTIHPSWPGAMAQTRADAGGKWSLQLATPAAGGPFNVTINDITLTDVLVGEVWLCSGQSNMVFSLKGSATAKEAIAHADEPTIRYFSVARQYASHDFDDAPGSKWVLSTPATAPGFSAVAWFFAKQIHAALGVPVGIVYSAWGGTPAEAWIAEEVQQRDTVLARYRSRWQYILDNAGKDSTAYHLALAEWQRVHGKSDSMSVDRTDGAEGSAPTDDRFTQTSNKKPAEPQTVYYFHRPWREPGVLFNGMIEPVIPFAVKGVLWYQGESNVNYADEYYRLMKTMIESWRSRWRRPDMPFYIVQISAFGYASMDNAAKVREAEYQLMKTIPHTGTAVTADLGNMKDIHYTRKKEVGDRLALIALAQDYGRPGLSYKGPEYRSAITEDGKVLITFEPSAAGLATGGSPVAGNAVQGQLRGFELGYRAPSGDSLHYVPAEAKIVGKKVLVFNDQVREPVEVRYGWLLTGEANLYDTNGLPAFPFRAKVNTSK